MALTVAQVDALIEQTRAALETALTSGATPATEYTIGDRRIKRADLVDYLVKLQALRTSLVETGSGIDPAEEVSYFDDPNF